MPANSDFFAKQPSFFNFDDYCVDAPYAELPAGWWVLVADIKGSTQAIQEGRYQDVNLAGASTIAAVLNASKNTEIPYVFGGDGATFAVPEEVLADVKEALIRTHAFVRSLYGLEMRLGAMPISVLKEKGARLEVAKYQLSPGNTLAFFRGGGLTLAEDLIKADATYLLRTPTDQEPFPNLVGLSCRWKPLSAKNGTILSLLVKSHNYAEISHGLGQILDVSAGKNSPVSELSFEPQWPALKSIRLETQWSGQRLSQIKKWAARCKQFAVNLVVQFSMNTGRPLGNFNPKKYKKEMATNADFRKFDDMLRMVVDCSNAQAEQVHQFLEGRFLEGQLFYGLHRSDHALMTCLVFSATDNQHLHFIDGAGGGYAYAATQMKSQLRFAAERVKAT